jgi:hypothetical protein
VSADQGDAVRQYGEEQPRPVQKEIPLSGPALTAAEELISEIAGAQTLKDVVIAAVSILHQAQGRQIQLVDADGNVVELQGLWKGVT